jgi:HlyD family secretion protein
LFIYRQQSGYTKVLTAKIVRQDLATVVSGTGQIKPKTYVNLGATSMGRITHLYVKEGDHVKKGQTVATIENVQQEANVDGQQAAIAAAKTDIASYIAAEKTAEANVEHAKADLEQKKLDWDRAQALYKDGIMAKQDFDAKKAAYDSMSPPGPGRRRAQPGQGQTDSAARPPAAPQVATCAPTRTLLDKTIAVAPFDGIVTNDARPRRRNRGRRHSEHRRLHPDDPRRHERHHRRGQGGRDRHRQHPARPARRRHRRRPPRQGLQGPRHPGRRSGPAALHRRRHLAVHHRHRRGQGLQGRGHARQPSNELRPGLSTTAKITTAHKPNVLSLPIQALTMHNPDDDKPKGQGGVQAASPPPLPSSRQSQPVQGVYVVDKDKRQAARQVRPVTTGITGATDIEVLSGLTEGQEIVTGPYKTLRALKATRWSSGTPPNPSTSTLGNS